MEAFDLTPTVLQSFNIGKVFRQTGEINSLSFSPDGQFLLSASSEIGIYNVLKGSQEKIILCKSPQVHFTNNQYGFLAISQQTIDYWSITNSKVIHSFPYQDATCIDMSPINDLFIASSGKTFEVFDLNTKYSVAKLDLSESTGNVLCKFDCYGLVFVVLYPVITEGKYKNILQMFDAKDFSKGAFAMWAFDSAEAVSIDFSYDGQYIIINTKSNQVFLIDAIDGSIKNIFKDYLGNGTCPVVFSPDSKYFFIGCDKAFAVAAVSVENCQKIYDVKGNSSSIKSLAWSPEHCMMATGNDHLVFWVPDYLSLR